MQHLRQFLGLLLLTSSTFTYGEAQQYSRRRLLPYEYTQQQQQPGQLAHNHAFYDYGPHRATLAPAATNEQPTQLWTGPPIVVDYLEQEQRNTPAREPEQNSFLSSDQPQRFAFDLNQGGNYYQGQQEQQRDQQLRQQQQYQLLLQQQQRQFNQQLPSVNGRSETFYSPQQYQLRGTSPYQQQPQPHQEHLPLPLANALSSPRDNARKYAAHFANYVRKYPYRIQPIFGPNVYNTNNKWN